MLTKITVADYMTKHVVTVTKETNVLEGIKTLLSHKITCAPVTDGHGHLVGLFSEKDCIKVFLESVYNQGMAGNIGDFMTTNVISVDADSSIVELAEKFEHSSVRSFPVFDDGELVGIISRTDVLKALASLK